VLLELGPRLQRQRALEIVGDFLDGDDTDEI